MTSNPPPIQPLQTRPLTEQAREALLRAFRKDLFPDGRLPPEAALAEQLGISRGTLRAALQSLSAEGIVSRRRRHGTYVNAHVLRASMPLNRLTPFAQLIEQSGHEASVEPAVHEQGPALPTEAAALQVEADTEVLRSFRLLRAGVEPVITITDVVSAGRLTVPPSRLRAASTTFEFLERNTASAVDYATSEIVPMVATAEAPAKLGLQAGTPYIQLHEILFDQQHERLGLSVICVVDRLVRLTLLRRGQ